MLIGDPGSGNKIPLPPGTFDIRGAVERKKAKANKGGPNVDILGALGKPQVANLAQLLEAQGNNQMQQSDAMNPGAFNSDPYSMLQQQLFGMANQSQQLQLTPYDQLKKLAEQQAGMQFDPMISALQNQMETTT